MMDRDWRDELSKYVRTRKGPTRARVAIALASVKGKVLSIMVTKADSADGVMSVEAIQSIVSKKGIATEQMRYLEGILPGYKKILFVAAGTTKNVPAIGLYVKCGWDVVERPLLPTFQVCDPTSDKDGYEYQCMMLGAPVVEV
jgi:hypothetical protein